MGILALYLSSANTRGRPCHPWDGESPESIRPPLTASQWGGGETPFYCWVGVEVQLSLSTTLVQGLIKAQLPTWPSLKHPVRGFGGHYSFMREEAKSLPLASACVVSSVVFGWSWVLVV